MTSVVLRLPCFVEIPLGYASHLSPFTQTNFNHWQADGLGGANGRDNGPSVTKWDQLAVHQELLRSLVRFG